MFLDKLIIVLLHTTYHCTLYKHKSHFTCSSTLTCYCTIYIVHHCTVHTTIHICTPTHVHSSLFILVNNFMPTYLSYLNFGIVTRLARKAAVSTLFVAVKKPTNKPRSAALNPEFQSTFGFHQDDFNLACVSEL